MKQEVIMKRELFGEQIGQNSKTEFLSATDLERAGNRWRLLNGLDPFSLKYYMDNKGTKEFIKELEEQFGKVVVKRKNKYTATWVHPLLFVDIALNISPKLKIEAYKWISDNLLKYRNDSGDSYKQLTGALWDRTTRKDQFSAVVKRYANGIRSAVGVVDWETATEEQLKQRDEVHKSMTTVLSVIRDADVAFKATIKSVLGKEVDLDE